MSAGGVRRAAQAMIHQATEAGLSQLDALGDMTPREIDRLFRAEAARRRAWMQRADLMAFLVGHYAALAVHAPRRYPRRPNAVRESGRRMPPEEMKRFFVEMAAREAEKHGDR